MSLRTLTDSDPESFDPLGQLPDVEIDQETNRIVRLYMVLWVSL